MNNKGQQNVLIIMADDQAPGCINYLDGSPISTPHLDRLAQKGSYFRPYTTVPVCTPARAEFLTGRNSFQNGCRWFGEPINSDITLLPRVYSEAGYHTCHIGKWHNNGHPGDFGYDETHYVFPQDMSIERTGHDCVFDSDGITIPRHSTELFGDGGLSFIERAPKDKPWFCYVAFHSPHDPRICPEPWMSMYDDKLPPLPPNFMPEHPFDNGDMLIRDELLASFPRKHDEIRRHRADYYAMISHHDFYTGRILDALKRTGQEENTIIVFVSDQGLAVGSHGLMGKESLYEHSVRAPLIFAGPGIPRSKRFDEDVLCGHYDVMPTLLELSGIEAPATSQGLSFAPVLRGENGPSSGSAGEDGDRLLLGPRRTIAAAYRDCMRMARDERFKLIYYPIIDRCQLFDLRTDPDETNDLLLPWRRDRVAERDPLLCPGYEPAVGRGEADAAAERLRQVLDEWQRDNGDTLL